MGACPVKMGAISVPVLVQLWDSNILQSCPPRSENYKSKKKTVESINYHNYCTKRTTL